jgi:hypothetical protein
MVTGAILSVVVLVFTAPAWWALFSGRPMSWASFIPVLPLTISSLPVCIVCGDTVPIPKFPRHS